MLILISVTTVETLCATSILLLAIQVSHAVFSSKFKTNSHRRSSCAPWRNKQQLQGQTEKPATWGCCPCQSTKIEFLQKNQAFPCSLLDVSE
jgi:hypothetical protein